MHMKLSMWTPLTPTTLYALLALQGNELHAYMVGEQIAKHSEGLVAPNRSTVARLLKRLVRRGWVSAWEPPPHPSRLRKQTYTLTPAGKRALKNELQRLRQLVSLTSWLTI